MFNDFPTKIKKIIFARVRLMDLYEVSGVSQEWWTLTMATCSPSSDEYSQFLDFQVKSCNEMKPKDGGWEKWMFIEFTDEKSIKLSRVPDEKIIEYLRKKEICVQKLIYFGNPSIFKNMIKLFPYLQTLDIHPMFLWFYNGEVFVLPDGLKRLRLTTSYTYPGSNLLDVFKHLERVDSLYIYNKQRILFDNISFDKLKNLKLDMSNQTTHDIKCLVTGSPELSSVFLRNGLIDKEWLGLFPTNIKKVDLYNMRLDKAIAPLFGNADAFVERQLMRFVCQDWTNIRLFKSSYLSNDNRYGANYLCRPQALEEELGITMQKAETPSGLLDSAKLQLKVLKLSAERTTKCDFDIIVPKSVRHFEWEANQFKAIDFVALFDDISNITAIRINSFSSEKIQFSLFPYATNLASLHISKVDDFLLASILRNCPCLKQLSLKWPEGLSFSKLPADLKSSTVNQLAITEPKDSIRSILQHFPDLVDLNLQYNSVETVTVADLAKLSSVEFVRMSFENDNNMDSLILLVGSLDLLPFSHVILGYTSCVIIGTNPWLSCVMCSEKAFSKRYLSSFPKNDFTTMNIQGSWNIFRYTELFYLKGVSSSLLSSWPECTKITYDLQDFIANVSV